MSEVEVPATLSQMSADMGAKMQARRVALGLTVKALAERAGVDRGRLAALEAGQNVRMTTVGAVDKALSDLEHEMGVDLPSQVAEIAPAGSEPDEPGGVIEFDITGDFGVHVVVKGPVRDAALLRQQTAELIREIRAKKADPSQG